MPRSVVTVGLCTLALLVVGGCQSKTATRIGGGPVVRQQRLAPSSHALHKVAVIPFYPAESLGRSTPTGGSATPPSRWEAAALVSNFFSEALRAQGLDVVGPSDVELAFTGEGHPVPRLDPRAAVQLSSRSFGATGIVLGKVMRYRERQGGERGATRPASVAFEVSLHDVPTGRRLWTGRFDETQQSFSANPFRAGNYPGGGTRWLSASELGRWGADELVKSMTASP